VPGIAGLESSIDRFWACSARVLVGLCEAVVLVLVVIAALADTCGWEPELPHPVRANAAMSAASAILLEGLPACLIAIPLYLLIRLIPVEDTTCPSTGTQGNPYDCF
jgi:hypothetical protein